VIVVLSVVILLIILVLLMVVALVGAVQEIFIHHLSSCYYCNGTPGYSITKEYQYQLNNVVLVND
jgi:hypothetical protein